MSVLGKLFGATVFQLNVDSTNPQPLTTEFAELAIELIDEFVESPNAVWVSIGQAIIVDETEPWNTTIGPDQSYDVKIVFFQDTREDRELLKFLRGTELANGTVNGIMYCYDFEPTLKDIVKWQGKELIVKAVDPIAPVDRPIVYILEFGL